VAGRKRVPSPATGITALRIFIVFSPLGRYALYKFGLPGKTIYRNLIAIM